MNASRLVLVFAMLALAGCSNDQGKDKPAKTAAGAPICQLSSEPKTAAPTSKSSEPAESIVPPKPAGLDKPAKAGGGSAADRPKPSLKAVDFAAYEKAIAGYKGKVVAVDAWATWCVPCRAKFPKYVALAKKYAGDGVVFVTLSFDQEEEEAAARDFLAEQGGDFVNFRMTDEAQVVAEKLKYEAIPRYFLYAADGKMVVNAEKLEQLEEELAKLLKR